MVGESLRESLLRRGDQHYEAARYDAALAEYSRATQLLPGSAIAFEKYAKTFLAKADSERDPGKEFIEDARINYLKATEIDPGMAAAHYGLGVALSKLGKHDAAAEAFETVIRIDENYLEVQFEFGEALFKSGSARHKEARVQYEKVVSLCSPGASALKAQCYYRLGHLFAKDNPEEALEKFRLAQAAGMHDSVIFHNLGVMLQELDRNDEAIKSYQEAIRLDDPKTRYAAQNNLGNIYNETYQNQEALEAFKHAAAAGSDWMAIALNNWGNVLFRMRRYREALEKYDESIKFDSKYAKAYYNRAFVLQQQGKHKEAKKAWRKALEVFDNLETGKNDLEHLRLCGNIHHEIFQDETCAEKAYLQALKRSDENLKVLLNLITLYVQQRDGAADIDSKNNAQVEVDTHFQNAERILKRCLREEREKRKDDYELRIMQGDIYQAVSKYPEAEEAYKMALKVLQGSGKSVELQAAYAGLGNSCIQQDDLGRGVEFLEKALQENPDDLLVRSRLAEAYRKLNDFTRAERTYEGIFKVSLSHVESYLGRGELYKAMGDSGDVDMYDYAIKLFSDALTLSKSAEGSKVLREKELAALFYSRGYASVKLYEHTKPSRDENLLRAALSDFEASHKKDQTNIKSKRAAEKLKLRLSYTRSQNILRSAGPPIIFLVSAFVFFSTQFFFLTSRPIMWDESAKIMKVMSESHYALLTFGSIIFMIAGLSLPELLKIKIAGVELEKSTIEQMQPFSSLGIWKG